MSTVLTEVTVNVTQEHIAAGEADSCWGCPVALALLDVFPDCDPSVSRIAINMRVGAQELSIDPPDEVREFIDAFDDGEPVEPFSFTLEVPA